MKPLVTDREPTDRPADPQPRTSAPTTRARWTTLVAGWSLLAVGGALLVLPGPGVPLVLGGLALLGREQAWARRLRGGIEERLRTGVGRAAGWLRRQPN